jgi:glycosyltransferase involved in cell wall biosynthesis
VIVVVREGDDITGATAKLWQSPLPLEVVEVGIPGMVAAMNAGLKRCTGEIVAITDDDAMPRAEWLSRIEAHFVWDERLGAVGGRDWVHRDAVDERNRALVGRVLWFGRAVGNHHIGAGPARDVDFLKGVNCAFRAAAICPIGFDERLRGAGAQVHNDMLACLAVKRAGWRIVYDPAIAVDHYPAPRYDRDERNKFDAMATADAAYNFRLALAELSPRWKRLAAFAWHYLVGTRGAPGVVNLLRMLANRDPNAFHRYRAARDGFARLGD